VKLSVSLSDEDVEVLDAYVEHAGLSSRSAGVQRAIGMLRHVTLEGDYAQAWAEWSEDEEGAIWDAAVADGLGDAPR
jgi:hypothetical protein